MEKEYNGYIVNCSGEVRRVGASKKLSNEIVLNGYCRVTLSNNGNREKIFVHRLVAMLFVDGRTDERNIVNHKDGDKKNNNYTNLEWVTNRENMIHAMNELNVIFKVETEPKRIMDDKGNEYISINEASKIIGICRKTVRDNIKKGKYRIIN